MKIAQAFASIIAAALLAQASAVTILQRNASTTLQANACGDPSTAVPLYRANSVSLSDHFYTINASEYQTITSQGVYTPEGIAAKIFATQELGTVPFYRFYAQDRTDHFYSIFESEGLDAGYTLEGITGYVYPNCNCGGTPFYRMLRPLPNYNHFYTLEGAEVTSAALGGYGFEGIAAFVLQ